MTQTIREAEGRNKVWIMADYGQGRTGRPMLAEWYKITIADYVENIVLEDLDVDQAESVRETLSRFKRGYAYQAEHNNDAEIFSTAKEARDWCWSRDC